MTRREFTRLSGTAIGSVALGIGCGGGEASPAPGGRLTIRARSAARTTATGSKSLGLGVDRDAILQMPAKIDDAPMPLLVLLHGAGGNAEGILRRLGSAPGDAGVAVLAPESQGSTWDAIRGSFGADVDFLDRALQRVFESVAVDPSRMAIGGFSDGATYAVSLGLINGDLFSRVAAFSAGFVVEGERHGKPRFFMSHGTADNILPIEQCGRPIAAELKKRGYDVTFREFAGGHEVPAAIAADAMKWIVSS